MNELKEKILNQYRSKCIDCYYINFETKTNLKQRLILDFNFKENQIEFKDENLIIKVDDNNSILIKLFIDSGEIRFKMNQN